jgi:transposase
MMGWQDRDQRQLFYEFSLDEMIPKDHLLRRINVFATAVLADLHEQLKAFYSDIGRPSIDPELTIRMLLVGYCYGIRHERRLCQEVALHLAYRWFCKLDLDDKVPHHSTFSVNRLGRFRESEILRHIFEGWLQPAWSRTSSRAKVRGGCERDGGQCQPLGRKIDAEHQETRRDVASPIRRSGYLALTKSFPTRGDAVAWAREKEQSIDRAGLPPDVKELKRLTVAHLLKRYELEITPRKRGAVFERSRIRQLLVHRMSQTSLNNLSGATVTQYRDDRLKVVKPRRCGGSWSFCVFVVARREWGSPIRENPFRRIRLPASFTGWRRGPALRCHQQAFSLVSAPLLLTPSALKTLEALPRRDEKVFPVTSNAVRLAWERLRARAGLADLRLHDLRHEARVSSSLDYRSPRLR